MMSHVTSMFYVGRYEHDERRKKFTGINEGSHIFQWTSHKVTSRNNGVHESCTKRRCLRKASIDLLDKTSHLTAFCV